LIVGHKSLTEQDEQADITGQACWLNSSNIENKEFYESHGFQTVAEIVIGNDNPTWHHPPIIAEIVSLSRRQIPFQ
jgi:hypothetical protein